jgi:TonB family protein
MKRFFLSFIVAASCLHPYTTVNSAGSPADLNLFSPQTSAMDVKAVRHYGTEYRGKTPWLTDVVKSVAPYYPIEDRRLHHTGTGWFRLYLDTRTGVVTQIAVLKSTGFSALDNSAITSFRHWLWQPGKWKEVDFKMQGDPYAPPPPGTVRLPPH